MLFVSPTLPIFCLHAKQIHLSPTRSTSLFFLHSPHLEIEIFISSSCILVVNKDSCSEECMIFVILQIFFVYFSDNLKKFFAKNGKIHILKMKHGRKRENFPVKNLFRGFFVFVAVHVYAYRGVERPFFGFFLACVVLY